MNLLHSGVDVAVIALWLGHFSGSTETTSAIYLHSTSARQWAIADAVSKRAETDMAKGASGKKVARRRKRAS
jgi:hypothetical protein